MRIPERRSVARCECPKHHSLGCPNPATQRLRRADYAVHDQDWWQWFCDYCASEADDLGFEPFPATQPNREDF